MLTIHNDTPHPVPPIAYLRYKENWAFGFFDVDRDVYGVAHFNYEPGHDRARVSCNLMVRGELLKYGNQMPFPDDFAVSREIGDGKLRVQFVEAHERMDMSLNSDALALELSFAKHAPVFNFDEYDAAHPEKASFTEVLSLATNQFNHTQTQAMVVSGSLRLKSGNRSREIVPLNGFGYRDHSRCVRSDNTVMRHVWSFLHFPQMIFGVTSLTSRLRPGTSWVAGYVHDPAGMRLLSEIEIVNRGELSDKMPATVEFKLRDTRGAAYTVVADIANRFGYVPLLPEAPGIGGFVYSLVENFCPIQIMETGDKGTALVEMGYSEIRSKSRSIASELKP